MPEGVTTEIKPETIKVKGPKGELVQALHPKVAVEQTSEGLIVSVKRPEVKAEKALWGLFRSLVQNMVTGVTTGFTRILEINGVGYKASVAGSKLTMHLGYSHPIEMEAPKGIEVKVEKNVITITGIDKQAVGQFAAVIRSQREPEPYKGKGIRYQGEHVRRKAGKALAGK